MTRNHAAGASVMRNRSHYMWMWALAGATGVVLTGSAIGQAPAPVLPGAPQSATPTPSYTAPPPPTLPAPVVVGQTPPVATKPPSSFATLGQPPAAVVVPPTPSHPIAGQAPPAVK